MSSLNHHRSYKMISKLSTAIIDNLSEIKIFYLQSFICLYTVFKKALIFTISLYNIINETKIA